MLWLTSRQHTTRKVNHAPFLTGPFARAFILAAALLGGFSLPAAGHGSANWIMADPNTRSCCGPVDCRPLELDRDQVEVRDGVWHVNGYPVADSNIYPTRGHLEYWACFWPNDYTVPRCLFVPGAS